MTFFPKNLEYAREYSFIIFSLCICVKLYIEKYG
jgi:hypothetical protein